MDNANDIEKLRKWRREISDAISFMQKTHLDLNIESLREHSAWKMSAANISLALAGILVPILLTTDIERIRFPVIFVISVIMLLGNALWLFLSEKTRLETNLNFLSWGGLEQQNALLKLRRLIDNILRDPTNQGLRTNLKENFDKSKERILAENKIRAVQTADKIDISGDEATGILGISIYLLFMQIWPLEYLNFYPFPLIIMILWGGRIFIKSLANTKQALDKQSELLNEQHNIESDDSGE